MKKLLFTLVLFSVFNQLNAQEVSFNNEEYKVKGIKILKNGDDVTGSVNKEDATAIFKMASEKRLLKAENKKREAAEKNEKKRERAVEKREKAIKKEQKKIEKRKKAEANVDKANAKLEKLHKKIDKLKRRGKMSPVDEVKWQEKITKSKTAIAKATKKLRKLK